MRFKTFEITIYNQKEKQDLENLNIGFVDALNLESSRRQKIKLDLDKVVGYWFDDDDKEVVVYMQGESFRLHCMLEEFEAHLYQKMGIE